MARYRFVLPLAALLLFLPAVRAAEEEDLEAVGKIPCMAVLAKSADENGGTWATAFRASRTVDLTLAVFLPADLEGEHQVELRIYTPRGHLYQSILVPLAAPGKAGEYRVVDGYPRALRQAAVNPDTYLGKAFLKAEVSFPVGGTLISSNSLYGRWKIEALLDGERKSCAKVTHLRIEE